MGYEKVVLCGWSGGGSLSALYQSEAEQPTITHTPAGCVDLCSYVYVICAMCYVLYAMCAHFLSVLAWNASISDPLYTYPLCRAALSILTLTLEMLLT